MSPSFRIRTTVAFIQLRATLSPAVVKPSCRSAYKRADLAVSVSSVEGSHARSSSSTLGFSDASSGLRFFGAADF